MKKCKNKAPSWKEINSAKNTGSLEFVKKNNELKKALNKFGWKHWDSWNIVDQGYSINFIKDRSELAFPRLHFCWYWDNQGGDNFWRGELYGFFNYFPNDNYMHPCATFEIRDITYKSLHLLPIMEERVVTALVTQTAIK